MNTGLLILRLLVGGFVAAHGVQKLTYFWGGSGLIGSSEEFRNGGFAGGFLTALTAGATQAGGGILLMLGLLTPLAAAGVTGVMTVAVTVKRPKGFWSQHDGYEYPAFLALAAIALAWTGPGGFSLDRAAGIAHYWNSWAAIAATVVGIGAGLLVRLFLHRPEAGTRVADQMTGHAASRQS
jgi:putative oxidoreductase